MGMKAVGKLHVIREAVQVTERFRKREFVLETAENPRYPQFVQFELTGDRCDDIDSFNLGDEVAVEFQLRGREWHPPDGGDTRYFNTLSVWDIVLMQAAENAPPPIAEPTPDLPTHTLPDGVEPPF